MSRRSRRAAGSESLPRLGTVLGIIYVFGFFAFTRVLTAFGYQYGLMPAGLAGIALAVLGCYTLRDSAIFQSPFRQAYPPRFARPFGSPTTRLCGSCLRCFA